MNKATYTWIKMLKNGATDKLNAGLDVNALKEPKCYLITHKDDEPISPDELMGFMEKTKGIGEDMVERMHEEDIIAQAFGVVEARFEKEAKLFIQALKNFGKNPDAYDNFECYLAHHFGTWLETYANTPEGMAREMEQFALIGKPVTIVDEALAEDW